MRMCMCISVYIQLYVNENVLYYLCIDLPVAPNYPPDHISVIRVDNNTALNISWDPIIPDHSKGEGDIFDYEIQYRNKKIPLAMATEQVSGTWVYIDGLYFKGVYEVRIRCVVMNQSIPLTTDYERGPWSKWVESTGESSAAGK